MSLVFVCGGLLPLMFISIFYLRGFKENLNNIILNDAENVLGSSATYVDTMLDEWKSCTEDLYVRSVEPELWIGDIILDEELSAEDKNRKIRKFLAGFDTADGVKSARFLDLDGNLYYSVATVGKVVNTEEMNRWKSREEAKSDVSHNMTIEPLHEDICFTNINDQVITVKRNLFDTGSLNRVENKLGTLYLDISEAAIARKLSGLDLGEKSGMHIIDQNGNEIYKSENQDSMEQNTVRMLTEGTEVNETVLEDESYYYIGRKNEGAGWITVINVHKEDVLKNMRKMERYILSIMGGSSVLLLFLYYQFSGRISRPIRELKNGMEKIQEGNLDTRVEVRSGDEVGILAEGLNRMTEQLSTYIGRVYGAEIKRKEAELKALKSQINPHYLYNTLDVIRMTAVESDDRKTAEMIESLARQLRYLTRMEQDEVSLREELENVSDYFMLIRVRYEERIELSISVPDELLNVSVLKLSLQPIVENAVKHGLKEKEDGRVWISAGRTGNILEITVMDNGKGVTEEELAVLRRALMEGTAEKNPSSDGGVGIVNIEERIRNKYGTQYGLHIESTKGKGTIVIMRVPFEEDEADEISYDFD